MTGSDSAPSFRPNAAQEAAVAHGSGPLRILAGAGSGKTTTLVRRILRLIEEQSCRPGELLMLTFTKKAAADMRRKVAAALPPSSEQPRIETYHAFALSLVQEFAAELGLPPAPALLTQGPVRLFARRHFDRLGIAHLDLSKLDGVIKTALDFFSWHRHEATYLQRDDVLLAQVDESLRPDLREFLEAHRAYRALLAEQGAVDYDDLIAQSVALLEAHPEVRQRIQARYRYLLVDEYQDTDHLQGRFIRLLTGPAGNITIVGDPDQTIYAFRGAALANILRFHEGVPSLTSIPMVTNYRSTPGIVAAANAVIAQNARRKEERLEADREQGALPLPQGIQAPDWPTEARWLAREVERLHREEGVAWREIAVLVRLNRHKLPLYAALVEQSIPVVVAGGMDLFDDPETARFIAYLGALAAPDSDSHLSVALTLPRYGLTDADVAALASERARSEKLLDVVARRSAVQPTLKAFLDEFWPLYRLQHTEGCEAAIRQALALHAGAMGLQARLNADQLLPLAQSFFAQAHLLTDPISTTPPLGQFCQYLAELRDLGETPEGVPLPDEEDGVRLMTVHAAKGLEFPVIFLPRLTDSDFPKSYRSESRPFPQAWHHDAAEAVEPKEAHFEEERRAFYVAVTRAMDRLYLSWAPVDPARVRALAPSRFLDELGDTVAWRPLPDVRVEAAAAAEALAAVEASGAAVAPGQAVSPDSLVYGLVSKQPARPLPEPGPAAPFQPRPPAVLSFSHLTTYQYCPYRFLLQYILRLPGRPAPAADAGVRLHAAIERLGEARGSGEAVEFAQFAQWAAAPPAPEEGDLAGGEGAESDEPYPSVVPADEEGALQNFWASEYGQSPPIASEQEFYIRVGGGMVRGFIDRIHRRADGSVDVVDFKTYNQALTPEEVRRSLQLPLYIQACREALSMPEVETAAMYFLKQDRTIRVRYSEAELAERLKEAERLVEAIQSGDWAPTPSPRGCGWCPYGEICPVSEGRLLG